MINYNLVGCFTFEIVPIRVIKFEISLKNNFNEYILKRLFLNDQKTEIISYNENSFKSSNM